MYIEKFIVFRKEYFFSAGFHCEISLLTSDGSEWEGVDIFRFTYVFMMWGLEITLLSLLSILFNFTNREMTYVLLVCPKLSFLIPLPY